MIDDPGPVRNNESEIGSATSRTKETCGAKLQQGSSEASDRDSGPADGCEGNLSSS